MSALSVSLFCFSFSVSLTLQVDGKDVSLGIPEAVRKGMAKAAASIPLARPGQVT